MLLPHNIQDRLLNVEQNVLDAGHASTEKKLRNSLSLKSYIKLTTAKLTEVDRDLDAAFLFARCCKICHKTDWT